MKKYIEIDVLEEKTITLEEIIVHLLEEVESIQSKVFALYQEQSTEELSQVLEELEKVEMSCYKLKGIKQKIQAII